MTKKKEEKRDKKLSQITKPLIVTHFNESIYMFRIFICIFQYEVYCFQTFINTFNNTLSTIHVNNLRKDMIKCSPETQQVIILFSIVSSTNLLCEILFLIYS